ncbi:MAG: DUF177 domain-containing protein [Chloroflexota bacterium]
MKPSRLRFNFGYLLEADFGTIRTIELDYPEVKIDEDVTLTPLRGWFNATRTTEGIYIDGQLYSTLTTTCVRCLEDAIIPITINLDELFYYPPYTAPEGEAFIGEDGFLDLTPMVRDLSLLEVPINPLCQPDCQGLCQECGRNLNLGTCNCSDDNVDPRLAALQQLLIQEDDE